MIPWSYITKNSQGPVTKYFTIFFINESYITKNSQGPVTKRSIMGI